MIFYFFSPGNSLLESCWCAGWPRCEHDMGFMQSNTASVGECGYWLTYLTHIFRLSYGLLYVLDLKEKKKKSKNDIHQLYKFLNFHMIRSWLSWVSKFMEQHGFTQDFWLEGKKWLRGFGYNLVYNAGLQSCMCVGAFIVSLFIQIISFSYCISYHCVNFLIKIMFFSKKRKQLERWHWIFWEGGTGHLRDILFSPHETWNKVLTVWALQFQLPHSFTT